MFPFGDLGWHQGILKRGETQKRRRGQPDTTAACLICPRNAENAENLCMEEDGNHMRAYILPFLVAILCHLSYTYCNYSFAVLAQNDDQSKFVSVREYYAYKLQIRNNDRSFLLQFGRLLQQYIVDSYVKLETQRLDFYRLQQSDIRREFLQGVVDAIGSGETEGSAVGQRILLPSSFIGCPRNMRQKYIDAMTLVQKFGKPDIFLTVTCNPNWQEIKEHLMAHEESQNRADLNVRIFHAKFKQIREDLFEKRIFGDFAAYTYVIEFQKSGLPHAHMLIILKPEFKMYRPKEYDHTVSAEIPNAGTEPHLHKMVTKHMLHGPCGDKNPYNVCMKKEGKCKNSFPKPFSNETIQTSDAYPIYRRRNNGVTVNVRGARLDNSWVVPYNPYLLAKYDCHINVEICSTIKAIKYIYKYICRVTE
ncbi:uncharacterized protein [Rutidosis leptorrhynchoides]|uniref:uncharacterized protein isoform X6 n=1 Tax=Rutidosis leptorrhynchoides TaxID=125765 RepID=UPI003A98EA3F